MHTSSLLLALARLSALLLVHPATAQDENAAEPQSNLWNANPGSGFFEAIQDVIDTSDFPDDLKRKTHVAASFERTNWAGSSVRDDPFYRLPPDASEHTRAGDLLKVEQTTNTSLYTLAPNLALSRILFNTETYNGTVVPASAFVLWPYLPRKFKDVKNFPVVTWAHGTTGLTAEAAPSHIRNLWYQYWAPFTLAHQGYIVVAADYAGQGVEKTADGKFITHDWLASLPAANDILYAVQAAQTAWPERLSDKFIVMGHSQGGGAAYAAAEKLADKPVPGYLGTVSVSPTGNMADLAKRPNSALARVLAGIGNTLANIFPGFDAGTFITEEGKKRYDLYKKIDGIQSVGAVLLEEDEIIVKPDWASNATNLEKIDEITAIGGKPLSGPVLVLQGTADKSIPTGRTDDIVKNTCDKQPDEKSDLYYVKLEEVGHVPTLIAGQRVWLDWITDRFSGVETGRKCVEQTYRSLLEEEAYEQEVRYYMQYPLYSYQTA
ncbi:MAG: hypothetical protein M1831_004289 [Alyxoria varia]|nr:MAG: hypothetical protein M1831_004289 [Alyxoria varia]